MLAVTKVLKRRTQEAVEEVRRITSEMADIAEKTLKAARGVGKRSRRRTEHERQSWFRRLQRRRAGQEGAISELKRRYGLSRTLYRGLNGCRRWVGGAI